MHLFDIVSYGEELPSIKKKDNNRTDSTGKEQKKLVVSKKLIQKCALFGLLGLVVTGGLYYFEVFGKNEGVCEKEVVQA